MSCSASEQRSVVDLLAGIVTVDVASATTSELAAGCRDARRVRGFLDAFEAAAARRSEDLKGQGCGGGAEELLTRQGRLSGREARRALNRADALEQAPALEAALGAGAISAGHVDVYANATRRAGPAAKAALVDQQEALAGLAAAQSPEEFATSCQRVAQLAADDDGLDELTRQRRNTRLRRFINEATGMFELHGSFDPELGVRIWRAIDQAIACNYPPDQRPDSTPDGPEAGDHLAALALSDLCTAAMSEEPAARAPAAPTDDADGADDTVEPPTAPFSDDTTPAAPPAPTPPPTPAPPPAPTAVPAGGTFRRPPRGEFTVVIDLRTLLAVLHEHSIVEVDPGGVTLPVDTLRRLACSADVLPVVLDGHGVTLDVGRSKRLATADQRRALRAMYPACAIDGCRVHFDRCEIHHLDPFGGAHGTGRTDLALLVPLCGRHHHAAHEGHWQLRLDPATRILTVTHPDGAVDTHPPPRARAA